MSEERDFLDELGPALAVAAAERGPCPPNEDLIDLAAGHLEPVRAAVVRSHAEVCGVCSLLLERLAADPGEEDELLLRRLDRRAGRRPAPWRAPRKAAWAALAAAAAVAALLLLPRPPFESVPPVLRGGGPALAQPLGEVSSVERFRWEGTPVWSAYRVEVELGDRHWSATTERPELVPPADLTALLEGTEEIRWRVVALGAAGEELATSQWAVVRVRGY
jgi:hypothetical protein